MAERKKFLLRVHPRLYAALEKWAADELRSVNSQIEYLLAEALRRAGRSPAAAVDTEAESEDAAAADSEADRREG